MKHQVFAIVAASALTMAGCTDFTPQQNAAAGAVGGGAAGLLLADAFDANDNWKVLATLGGAAAGTLIAQNEAQQTCAYARGDGTYYQAACP